MLKYRIPANSFRSPKKHHMCTPIWVLHLTSLLTKCKLTWWWRIIASSLQKVCTIQCSRIHFDQDFAVTQFRRGYVFVIEIFCAACLGYDNALHRGVRSHALHAQQAFGHYSLAQRKATILFAARDRMNPKPSVCKSAMPSISKSQTCFSVNLRCCTAGVALAWGSRPREEGTRECDLRPLVC